MKLREKKSKRYKIAVLTSHPIQYQVSLFRKLSEHPQLDTMVYFSWNSLSNEEGYYSPKFGRKIKWDIPLLEGYKYKFLKNYSPTPSIFRGFFGLINFGIIKELFKNKYDAIIIHGWNYFTSFLTVFISKLRKTKVFLRGDNPYKQEIRKNKFKILLKKFLLQRILFNLIDGFLYVGKENKEFYKFYGVPEYKLFFVPHAIENERFIKSYNELVNKKDEIKKEIGIPPNKIIILFSGKLIEKKRPMDLLVAYEKVKTDNKALVYVGDGYLRKKLEEYAERNKISDVYFVGFKNQTEIPKYYAIADIFVLPSTSETWGLVVNEAMCFHLPIIVSDIVGCGKDLVKHGENGYIFPVGDVSKLAEYLEDLIINKEKRRKFGERSFEIIQDYSYEKDIEGILKALKSIRR